MSSFDSNECHTRSIQRTISDGPRNLEARSAMEAVITEPWAAQWLEHRTPDRKTWVRCPMPPNTLPVHSVRAR
ncbi:hypothetical protein TNCV_1924071 [Trichonephila clavipes]|nr:hypothetical protein TNCV_1924071 [Trichonephila clavipes]